MSALIERLLEEINCRCLFAVGNPELAKIAQALTRVTPDNLSNIFGHSLARREESEGHDFLAKDARNVDASVHDPVDAPDSDQFRRTRKGFFAGIEWSSASLRGPTREARQLLHSILL
jgi:hypothetical protein